MTSYTRKILPVIFCVGGMTHIRATTRVTETLHDRIRGFPVVRYLDAWAEKKQYFLSYQGLSIIDHGKT